MKNKQLAWLDQSAPAHRAGIAWGVPWRQGELESETVFGLSNPTGQPVPMQSKTLAVWPDGSIKWSGHAISAGPDVSGPLQITPQQSPAPPATPVEVQVTEEAVTVQSGALSCRIPCSGPYFVESLALDGRDIGQNGELVCLREDRSAWESSRSITEETFSSRIHSAIAEESGPVRVVVKIDGDHHSENSGRSWLPFTLRLYFYAGVPSIRMTHTFVFDGDATMDFIRGLGVRFAVPLHSEPHNRHVRLAGEKTGLFSEPLQVLYGRRNPSPELYRQQVAGKPILVLAEMPMKENIAHMAVWSDFKLSQLNSDSFQIQKRTGAHSAWINVLGGNRSLGSAYIGDSEGGLALGAADFWQRAPSGIEITDAATESAKLTLWLWSPDSPAMDLRHYDITDHGLEASYEDIEPGFSTPHGIARTSELTITPFSETPDHQTLLDLARTTAQPPHLVCSPEDYHDVPVFGVWSLPQRSAPAQEWIEAQLDDAIALYQTEIEQRRWYGFWHYGDVMHSYDATRHSWRYDMGGCAWANTELMPDLWLWYSFLRTGRADIFRMAQAMTQHTQEVDTYHLGPFKGLGSRHNVIHWGCGCKEARIGQASLKRFLYYLTADERMGDLLDEVAEADWQTVGVDPLRKIEPPTQYPTHARVGPDWFAFCGNWLAAWERTGDTRYRDQILTGMRCMAAMPYKLFSGESYGYDPATKKLFHLHEKMDVPHLAALMGGPELMMELTPLVDYPEWTDAWLHYCRLLQAPPEQQERELGAAYNNGRGPHYAKMTAWAAKQTGDPALAAWAWQQFFHKETGEPRFAATSVPGPDVAVPLQENAHVSTNNTAQWALNAIQLLALIGDSLDSHAPDGVRAYEPR